MPAILAALAMTILVGAAILSLGFNALFNSNTVPVAAAASASQAQVASPDAAQISQLQQTIKQYQTREQQYQTELSQAATELNQSQAQLGQYQNLVAALQNAGVIQIRSDGRVLITSGRNNGDD